MTHGSFIPTHTILDRIMAHKVDEIAQAKARIPEQELRNQLGDAPPPRDFAAALNQDYVALIAEVKKASPSKGVFLADFDPLDIAQTYASYGASAISILTDEQFFQGHLDYLRQIRHKINLPILRKEFILDWYQVIESRVAGADALLLIAACLDDSQLADLYQLTTELGMVALVEVHNEQEMERSLTLHPQVIGINNRNLHTFEVDLHITHRLAALCPTDTLLVSESGIYTTADVEQVAKAGTHAILVGESLILAEDRPTQIQALGSVKRS